MQASADEKVAEAKSAKVELMEMYRELRGIKENRTAADKRIEELSSRISNASVRVSSPARSTKGH